MGIEKLHLSRVIYRVDMKMERKTFFFIYFWKLYYLEDEDWALSCTQKLRSNLEKCIFYEYNFRKKKCACSSNWGTTCIYILYLYFIHIYLWRPQADVRTERPFCFLCQPCRPTCLNILPLIFQLYFRLKNIFIFMKKK